jgi:TonB family protein
MRLQTLGLLGSLLGGASYPATAQLRNGSTVCLVEPVPELLGGGGTAAIVAAVGRRVVYPPPALRAGAEGRVVVRFSVSPAGYVRKVEVISAFRRDCGLAAVRAVRQLPRFRPRWRALEDVSFSLPLSFCIDTDQAPQPRPVRKRAFSPCLVPRHPAAAPADKSRLVCYFEPMPELLPVSGTQTIVAAVRQRLVYPPHAGLVCLTGRTYVKFTITAAGQVGHVEVVKGLWPPFDSAAVQAVRQLPCFRPMAQPMSCTVPVAYGQGER